MSVYFHVAMIMPYIYSTYVLEPPVCGTMWSSDTHPTHHHWATVFDGFEIGMNYHMNNPPKYMGNDWLSRINVNKGDWPRFKS